MAVSTSKACREMGYKATVPVEFAEERMCVFRFTLFIEHECAEIRRETALGNASHQRQVECIKKIVGRGDMLVSVATNGFPMSDELKTRILSTVLTLQLSRKCRSGSVASCCAPIIRFPLPHHTRGTAKSHHPENRRTLKTSGVRRFRRVSVF